MKQMLSEMNLSVPFRTICSQCKKELNFNDRKYTDSWIREKYRRYYCEDCKNQSGVRKIS